MRLVCLLLLTGLVLGQIAPLPTPKAPKLGVVVYEDEKDGVVVEEVRSQSAAAAGGLKPGDRIVKVGDLDIKGDRDLVKALSGARPGHTITVEVLRGDERKSLPITFKKAKDGAANRPASPLEDAKKALAKAEKLLAAHKELEAVKKALAEIATAKKAIARAGGGAVSAAGGMPDMSKVTARVQELLADGATPEEIEETIAEEFPGVRIKIGGGEPEDGELRDTPPSKKK